MICPPWKVLRSFLGLPWVLFLCLWIGVQLGAFGQDEALAETSPPSAHFTGGGGPVRPNADLPDRIPAPPGGLTLFADFASAGPQGIPLYLVNRTAATQFFFAQDGDLFIALEEVLPDGAGRRAQMHVGAWCGDSYGSVVLSPGQHIAFYGYQPTDGVKARVRFASFKYNNLVSNEGEGFVSPRDIEDASRDEVSRRIPNALAAALLTDSSVGGNPSAPPSERVAALRLLQVLGKNPYYQDAAAALAQQWEKNPGPKAEQEGAKAIRDLLAHPASPATTGVDALRERCFAILQSPRQKPGEFGAPENELKLVWKVLADLAGTDTAGDAAKWKPAVALTARASTPDEIASALGIFAVPWLADELLTDDFLEAHLRDGDAKTQKICAQALSRRGLWKRLAQAGLTLSPPGQIIVLQALAYPGNERSGRAVRDPEYDGENKFWEHCMETQPLEAAYALYTVRFPEYASFNRIVHDPLHDALLREAERGANVSEDFDLGPDEVKLLFAVRFLASWSMKEDDEVFQKLLAYRGYRKSERLRSTNKPGSDEMEKFAEQAYTIREAARDALCHRGQPVPQDIVLKKDVSP